MQVRTARLVFSSWGIDPAGEDHISAFRGFTGQGFQWKTVSDIPAGIW
jgi:hypothetical protein